MKDEIVLIDSNILVYAYDKFDIEKNKKSMQILEKCWKKELKLAVSIQNLSEFYVVTTKKFKAPIEKNIISNITKKIIEFEYWKILIPKESTLIKAMEINEKYNTEYYDSLIAATMLENGITKIYTENVKDFVKIKELEVINPLN